ncbi:ParB N-terminal domain-containing protein [Gloeocapsopsis dulcis]|uniref:ParB N-terminal domain-containing protein n=1 Tax=Gloeocapsopsis dulcis TaxID=2859516 RepID=UPI000CF71D7E|nr:ParB N-terminal domain-containing protein [Gloeocapsopsis dulcis]WNN92272.1 ParB N-terminal domain-containing protein [Gloeocapsopsis dulcis]
MSNIELSLIRTDDGTQPRAELNSDLIDEYAKAMTEGAKFPPVTVFYDQLSYWLADGFHRFEAAKKIGSQIIDADIQQGIYRDAILYSVGANATHGLRRSNADKRKAVLKLLSDPEWCQWSNSEIAKQCGVGEWLVRKLKEELSSCNTKIDQTYARKSGIDENTLRKVQQSLVTQTQERTAQRQGKTYTINTANIGSSSRGSKKVVSTEKSVPTEVAETNLTQVVSIPPPSALSLKERPDKHVEERQIMTDSLREVDVEEHEGLKLLLKLESEERVGSEAVKTLEGKPEYEASEDIHGLSEEGIELAAPLQPEVNYPPRKALDKHVRVRIINIKRENPQPVEEAVQIFELAFPGVCVEIEGRPDILVNLFQQMQYNPTFAEEVLQQASLLATSG